MRLRIEWLPIEVLIAATMLALMLLLSVHYGMPIVFPSGGSARFVGIHYIYPLIGVALLGAGLALFGHRRVASQYFLAFPCYAAVLFAHFNMKLWLPHINPMNFDAFYWRIDMAARPLVDLCMWLRESMLWLIPYDANFYMISFIGLFYCSFLYHALRTPDHFGKLVVAVLLFQSFGAFAYLIAPAVGPFLYEPGVNPLITENQRAMLAFYQHSVAGGPDWIARHGGEGFTAGLAAMPSLHAGRAFLFLLFAWRYGRFLVPLYALLFLFIIVAAVASRWHYLIDIPAGVLLAWISFALAARVVPVRKEELPEDAPLVAQAATA